MGCCNYVFIVEGWQIAQNLFFRFYIDAFVESYVDIKYIKFEATILDYIICTYF